jgi:hypothetical protein
MPAAKRPPSQAHVPNPAPPAPPLPPQVPPVFKALLRPHIDDMDHKMAPGFSILSWTSMNIDGYLHRFKQVGRGAWPCVGARRPLECPPCCRPRLPCVLGLASSQLRAAPRHLPCPPPRASRASRSWCAS